MKLTLVFVVLYLSIVTYYINCEKAFSCPHYFTDRYIERHVNLKYDIRKFDGMWYVEELYSASPVEQTLSCTQELLNITNRKNGTLTAYGIRAKDGSDYEQEGYFKIEKNRFWGVHWGQYYLRFAVVSSDFDNYKISVGCFDVHLVYVMVYRRSPQPLPKDTMDMIHDKLTNYGVEISTLHSVKHDKCNYQTSFSEFCSPIHNPFRRYY